MVQRLLALISLILTSPLLIIFFLWVKHDSKGPFVFKQLRLGKDKQPFWLYKIRTMKLNADKEQDQLKKQNEASGPVFKIKNDPRFTRAGRLISHTGLDEILQLVNILKGEMAFVGPRPLPVVEAKAISPKYKKRFRVLPGITSLWVIRGAQHQDFNRWMKDDLEYIKKRSILFDLKIILKSIQMLILMSWRQIKT